MPAIVVPVFCAVGAFLPIDAKCAFLYRERKKKKSDKGMKGKCC
jgi:hypothetical protein